MTTVFLAKSTVVAHAPRSIPQWDTYSGLIGIDNRCSACMSHMSDDFVGDLQECNKTIKGFGGRTHYNIYIGTLKWHWEDNQGKIHKCVIPQSYYVPERGVRLLSPQHWAQTQQDIKLKSGTMEVTNNQSSTLHWKQSKFKRTVMLSKHKK